MGMKAHGELTAWIASKISDDWKKRGYDVLYDHGTKNNDANIGKIVSWIGDKYIRESELGQLDIAIVKESSGQIFALLEIEETADRPKTFLGDVFSMLMGEHITFGGKRELTVDKGTTLIIIGQSKVRHQERNKHLQNETMRVKFHLSTANSVVGNIVIDTFTDEDGLSALVPSILDKAFKGKS
jgi:hypothetical protein